MDTERTVSGEHEGYREESYLEAFENEGMEEVAHSPALVGMLGFDVVLEERGENGR